MKRLEIDWLELESAFETQSWEISYYLDKETGRVLMVTEEANRQLERIDDLYNLLQEATQGRGAFGRFKGILRKHPAEEQRWYAFRDNRLQQQNLDWLAEEGIEPINMPEPEPTEAKMEDQLEFRHKLLDEVLIFTRAACRIPDVTRVALIGSLTTDKPDPYDADMLVTVTDDADLTQLATVARKLQGHAQSFARGGEVFLADPQHHYLGRTCPWKRFYPHEAGIPLTSPVKLHLSPPGQNPLGPTHPLAIPDTFRALDALDPLLLPTDRRIPKRRHNPPVDRPACLSGIGDNERSTRPIGSSPIRLHDPSYRRNHTHSGSSDLPGSHILASVLALHLRHLPTLPPRFRHL